MMLIINIRLSRCVRGKEKSISDGKTGRVVQEVLYAAYASAGLGRKVELPSSAGSREADRSIDLWKRPDLATFG